MKEMIKQKMMNKLHRRNSSSSSTASIDYTSGERLQFKFSALQALQVPKGWDKLSLSLISVETGKTIAKTGRAAVQNGICRWNENLSERIWVPHDDASKGLEQCLYKLFISMGSGRSGILGEVTVNLSGHVSSENSTSIAQPLKNCSHGTILQVEIQCLTPRPNLRWTDTDSFTEEANVSDDLDNTSDASDGRITKSVGSSTSSNFQYTSQAGGLGSRDRSLSGGGSRSSFDSMDDSFANDLIGRQDSIRSSSSAQDSSYHVYDSPKSSHSLYSSGSGKNVLSHRQDSGKVSLSIPASPLRTSGPTEFALEAEGAMVEELRTEARMWERNTRKLMVDLDFLRKESRDQTKKLENATMEVLASRTECDGLKHEINYLKVLLDESAVKEKDADNLKLQVQDKDDIRTEMEEEIKFQKELNDNLSLQLNRTQESNLELVSILQELEETIEKQRLEIESLTVLKLQQDGVNSVSIEDSKMTKLECQIQQLKEEAKKRELDGIDAGYLQLRCNDLESKCVELEVSIQGFKDKTYYLDGELNKYREKALEQEKEVGALKQSLKSQQEGKHENSFTREAQAEYNLQHGEETKPMIKDPCNVENKMDDSLKDNNDMLEKFNMELKSRVEDLGKELLAKTSEIEVLKSGLLLKGREIPRWSYNQKDLKTQLSDMKILKSQLNGSLKAMQSDGTLIYQCLDKVKSDMVMLNGTKDSQIAANKILEKKLLELESCNKELELNLAELEVENIHLSERISGLETQLRYLTDARESSRLEIQHSETCIENLQAEIKRLEEEIETSKVDMRQKLQDMQKRWLEAQEECEYLKKANPKLQTTAESLIEECSALEKSNRELKQQRLDLYNRNKDLEAELRESQHNFSKLSSSLDALEDKFSLMINGITTKENFFVSELEDLYLQNKEQTEKFVMGENLFNQMYSEKMVEIDNLQQEVAHLSTQIYATQDERDRMASEAILEMHVLRSDKDKLEKVIEDVKEKFRSSEKKLNTIQDEYEARIQKVMVELTASKQNHGVLEANLDKLMELLENSRSNEENLRITIGELHNDLKHREYEGVQLTEEISSLKDLLQKVPLLQNEVVALKNSLNDVKYENERLEASLQMITADYEELKEEKTSLFQKTSSMQKRVIELEDHDRSKVALEEQIMRLRGDLSAKEALCAQDAELKNELGRLKRSNSHLQRKINHLHEDVEASRIHQASIDAASRIRSLENELAEALEANDVYKAQIKNFVTEGHDKDASSVETELKELQERYFHMSLKYAEVSAEREELVSKLKALYRS